MAWTTSKSFEYAAGNAKVQAWVLDADSATLELDTGLNVVDHAMLHLASGAASAASFGIQMQVNKLSAATASKGYIALTGAVSGNRIYLTVWGH